MATKVVINPELLTWARSSAGYNIETIAKKLNKPPYILSEWEKGTKHPTLRQLERFSEICKRPLAAFFLQHPPKEPPPPTDFRVLYGQQTPVLSPKTRFAIRRARRLQMVGADLQRRLGVAQPTPLPTVDVSADPENVTAQLRERLAISPDEQFAWRDSWAALTNWRQAVEKLGIFTFQFSMPLAEIRGFSLSEGQVPVIVVNSADAVVARTFTLFHELCHLLLGEGGICNPTEMSQIAPEIDAERFCNHVAGAFLVPLHALNESIDYSGRIPSAEALDEVSRSLARKFKVSKYVILRRLLYADRIDRAIFQGMMNEWSEQDAIAPKKRKRGGGGTIAHRSLQEHGTHFVSVVLSARDRGIITHGDVSEYLSLRQKYMDALESLARAL